MTTPRIVLVHGFWLGAWAWDDVATAFAEIIGDVADQVSAIRR
jgi:hypothetical protein